MPERSSFLNTPAGKVLAGLFVVGGLALAVWTLWGDGTGSAIAAANRRLFVDASNGKSFWLDLNEVSDIPTMAPSGQKTGYPAELCFWTADGKPKDEPTGVILNEALDKTGPTFCPDCKRLVVGRNPRPNPDSKPPPTEAEFRANPGRFRTGGGE